MSPQTASVTLTMPGSVDFPAGSALLQIFTSGTRASTAPWNVTTLGYQTDTATFWSATGTSAGNWQVISGGGGTIASTTHLLKGDGSGNASDSGIGTSGTTITATLSGNASTATALQTARTINGTSFDGSANITVAAAAGTLTGSTLASGVTTSSLTSAAGGSFGTAAYVNTGTSANQIVKLDGSGKLPAVDGSQLTNLPAAGASDRGAKEPGAGRQ